MSEEKYEPTPEEIKKAEERMTDIQSDMSKSRYKEHVRKNEENLEITEMDNEFLIERFMWLMKQESGAFQRYLDGGNIHGKDDEEYYRKLSKEVLPEYQAEILKRMGQK